MKRISRLLLTTLLFQALLASSAWSVEVGETAPHFKIKTLEGEQLSQASLAGKPLMLVFWNTWCPTCKKELPEINRMVQRLGPKGPTVVAVNTGLNDSVVKAKAYWQKNGFRFASGFDQYFEVGESFGVQGVPMVVLIDALGKVRYKGSQLPENMEAKLKELGRR